TREEAAHEPTQADSLRGWLSVIDDRPAERPSARETEQRDQHGPAPALEVFAVHRADSVEIVVADSFLRGAIAHAVVRHGGAIRLVYEEACLQRADHEIQLFRGPKLTAGAELFVETVQV